MYFLDYCVIMMQFNEVGNAMSKIRISTVLDSAQNGVTSYTSSGILKGNEIVFYENDIRVVIIIKNNGLQLRRIHEEYTICLSFENTLTKEGTYDIKYDSMQIPISVTTNILDIKEGSIHIEYVLFLGGVDQGKFVYDIKYEVIL